MFCVMFVNVSFMLGEMKKHPLKDSTKSKDMV